MACQVVIELKAQPGSANVLRDWMRDKLPGTRGFDGCIAVLPTRSQEDPSLIVLLEQWASRQHFEKYLEWRVQTGVVEELGAMLGAEPQFRYFDYLGV
ncbi:putative quinol monooxygenase [Xylophilus sp. ASV27]|uniref:putative quinol monooxygenase n=1 Tax=Xylophilus sp. ASV27 TaxID=2795129 RepID=UPI0018EA3880|nr:antibiotic biosynthesis monooxygenase [Xylophilus sp. ASV27]